METGHRYNSSVLSNSGQGLSNSGTDNKPVVEPISVNTVIFRNPDMGGEDTESNKILSGAGEGDIATSSGATPQRWGHTTTSGSRIEIDDTTGAESITIVHGNSQAGIKIEPDGSVFVSAASKRGGGIGAPFGDFFIKANGDLVISGNGSVQIDTAGDLSLVVGGTLTLKAGAIKVITNTLDETIDGTAVRTVTNDQATTIGGIKRDTIAGDFREQITGKKIMDVGSDYTSRVGGMREENTSKDNKIMTGGTQLISAVGAQQIISGAEQTVSAKGNQNVISGGNTTVGSQGNNNFVADGKTDLSSGSDTSVTGSRVLLGGGSVHSDPPIDNAIFASTSSVATMLGSVTPPPAVSPAGAGSTPAPSTAEKANAAKVTEANDIVDELTTKRKFPEYPTNGKLEMGSTTSLGTISGDETNQAQEVFDQVSSQNSGNASPMYESDKIGTYPEDSNVRSNDIAATDVNMQVPSRSARGTKISKYFTLGDLMKSHSIPESKWESVVKNFILVANNVLDPIKEKFPTLIITSTYRSNSKNHITGRAIDMVVASRDIAVHAEIAKFARDNLPCDQVFLEKNTAKTTHVHIRVSPVGQKTKPVVLSCADPKCQRKTAGIDVSYLLRNGARSRR